MNSSLPKPPSLFKYFAPSRTDVLANCRMRFTPIAELNDLFEGRPVVTQIATNDEMFRRFRDAIPEAVTNQYNESTPAFREKVPIDQFVQLMTREMLANESQYMNLHQNLTPPLIHMAMEKFGKSVGVCCFSTVATHQLMWAHYAQNNQGFVIEFDQHDQFFDSRRTDQDEFGILRPVAYRKHRPNKPMTELDGLDIFFVKSDAWHYEQEWRMLRPLMYANHTTAEGMHLFDFPARIVKSVILGPRCDSQNASRIREAIACGPLRTFRISTAVASSDAYGIDIG